MPFVKVIGSTVLLCWRLKHGYWTIAFSWLCLVSVLSVFLICLLSCIFQREPTWMAQYSLIVWWFAVKNLLTFLFLYDHERWLVADGMFCVIRLHQLCLRPWLKIQRSTTAWQTRHRVELCRQRRRLQPTLWQRRRSLTTTVTVVLAVTCSSQLRWTLLAFLISAINCCFPVHHLTLSIIRGQGRAATAQLTPEWSTFIEDR